MKRAFLVLALLPAPAFAQTSDRGYTYAMKRQPEMESKCDTSGDMRTYWCGAALEMSIILTLGGYCLDEESGRWKPGYHPSGQTTCSDY